MTRGHADMAAALSALRRLRTASRAHGVAFTPGLPFARRYIERESILVNAASRTILLGLVLGCAQSQSNDDDTPPETDGDADGDMDVQWFKCDEAMGTTGCTQRISDDDVEIWTRQLNEGDVEIQCRLKNLEAELLSTTVVIAYCAVALDQLIGTFYDSGVTLRTDGTSRATTIERESTGAPVPGGFQAEHESVVQIGADHIFLAWYLNAAHVSSFRSNMTMCAFGAGVGPGDYSWNNTLFAPQQACITPP